MEILFVLWLCGLIGKATWKGFWHTHDAWQPDR